MLFRSHVVVGACSVLLVGRVAPAWVAPTLPVEGGWLELRPYVAAAVPDLALVVDAMTRSWASSGLAPLLESPLAYGLLTAVIFLASLLPDIDHQHSRLNQLFGTSKGPIGWLAHRVLRFVIGPHRTTTHYAITWLVFSGVVTLLIPLAWSPGVPYGVAASLAYGSHIAADMMTERGVPVWGPFNRRSYHIIPRWLAFRTGSLWELLIVAGLAAATIVVIFALGPLE
jgi:membrane-bound metal-dependent hydrolase YbcI (DUF457 family)